MIPLKAPRAEELTPALATVHAHGLQFWLWEDKHLDVVLSPLPVLRILGNISK